MGKYLSSGLLICIEENIFEYDDDFDKVLNNCISDEELKQQILDCTKSKTGNTWQHHMAQKTESHEYVHWVIVDGLHDIDVETQILNNLTDYLCNLPGKTCNKKFKYYDETFPF